MRAVPTDVATVIAVSALAFIVSNLLHEGLAHGGACLLVGGKPLSLTAVYFDNDPVGLSDIRSRLIAAGGPIVNLLTGLAGLLALRRMKGVPGPSRYFLWLVTTLGLFMATGFIRPRSTGKLASTVGAIRCFLPTHRPADGHGLPFPVKDSPGRKGRLRRIHSANPCSLS